VALLLFAGGGVFAINEGWEKVHKPEPLEHVWVGLIILLISLVLESAALWQAVSALNKQRGPVSFFPYLRQTTDVDLVVLIAENGGDVIGLLFALVALGLAVVTGDTRYDALGSIVIGVLLTAISWFLAREVHSLLLGERAHPDIENAFKEEARSDPQLGEVLRIITVQQGPSQVMLAAKIKVSDNGVTALQLAEAMNRLEARMRARCPEVKWQFLEPDTTDD
jgi:divalent metal cation (Fe/Co/Zn/Cd) transporter